MNKEKSGVFSAVKDKMLEIGVDYFKKNFESTKKEVFKHIENIIEKKIKKELRKYSLTLIAIIALSLASFFLIYGLISMGVTLLNLPSFLSQIFFGLLLFTIAVVVYLIR